MHVLVSNVVGNYILAALIIIGNITTHREKLNVYIMEEINMSKQSNILLFINHLFTVPGIAKYSQQCICVHYLTDYLFVSLFTYLLIHNLIQNCFIAIDKQNIIMNNMYILSKNVINYRYQGYRTRERQQGKNSQIRR